MTHIMLCMIVRNESQIIERCLNAALPIIDAAVICDTGSEDTTTELIQTTLAGADCPYRVAAHEWENFGKNRSRSFEEARDFAVELGWDLSSSYALFLDADMVLRVAPEFQRDDLSAAGYNLTQVHSTLRYENIRLARLDVGWICVGATHEYWALGEHDGEVESLTTLLIDDLGDGGAKADKYERDIRLLTEDLERDPGNPRTIFYLAQSYYDLRQFEQARDLYRQRAALGGWEEECWYASYKAGLCSIELGEKQQGFGELLQAWNRRPTRAEPLVELAKFARIDKQHHIAHLAAEQALAIPQPTEDRLFIEVDAYGTRRIEEIAINAFYTGRMERGADACDALLHRHLTDENSRALSMRNIVYYTKPLTTSEDALKLGYSPELWGNSFSPSVGSIWRTGDGYMLINRFVNYYHERGTDFITRDRGGQYLSCNASVKLDRDLGIREVRRVDDQIIEEFGIVPTVDAQVCGVEDVRLFRWKNAWWFVGNSRQFERQHYYRVVLGRYNDACDRIESIVALEHQDMSRNEKNWMPLIHDDRLYLLYLSQPTIVVEADPETGNCKVVSRKMPAANLSSYRGSSPFVPFNGRLLGIVHDVAFTPERRIYLHRFIILDPETWTVTHASHPFTFLHTGVEYCCGLTWAHEPGDLLISFSFEERESWLTRIDRERVREMLRPIASLAQIEPLPGLWAEPAKQPTAPAISATSKPPRWWSRRRRQASLLD